MKWLLNLLTRGGYSRLESDNPRLRLAVMEAETEREDARNALAEMGTERDGLLNQLDGLRTAKQQAEAHRDRVIESVTQYCKDIEAVEIDRDLSLAHAVRLYAIANKLHEDLAQAQEWRELAQATMEMGLRLARNLQASRDEYDRRFDAATVRAEALSREVKRQRGVIVALRDERDEARQNAYDQKRDERGRFTANASGTQRRKLDFTHFKRHERGNLQYDGTEWRGVSVHRSWRSIVKNLPTPTTSGYAQSWTLRIFKWRKQGTL